jgi:hypothetical protein
MAATTCASRSDEVITSSRMTAGSRWAPAAMSASRCWSSA